MRSPRTTHIFPGCCSTFSTARSESTPSRREECLPGAPDRFRLAERARRAKDGEKASELPPVSCERLKRVHDPFDVG